MQFPTRKNILKWLTPINPKDFQNLSQDSAFANFKIIRDETIGIFNDTLTPYTNESFQHNAIDSIISLLASPALHIKQFLESLTKSLVGVCSLPFYKGAEFQQAKNLLANNSINTLFALTSLIVDPIQFVLLTFVRIPTRVAVTLFEKLRSHADSILHFLSPKQLNNYSNHFDHKKKKDDSGNRKYHPQNWKLDYTKLIQHIRKKIDLRVTDENELKLFERMRNLNLTVLVASPLKRLVIDFPLALTRLTLQLLSTPVTYQDKNYLPCMKNNAIDAVNSLGVALAHLSIMVAVDAASLCIHWPQIAWNHLRKYIKRDTDNPGYYEQEDTSETSKNELITEENRSEEPAEHDHNNSYDTTDPVIIEEIASAQNLPGQ